MASGAATETSLEESYRFCEALTRDRARNFYFAFLSLPAQQRRAIYVAYAFCRGCDDYSDDDIELEQKVRLLAQYRDQLHACLKGEPEGPVFVALYDVVQRYRIPHEYFDDIISGVEMDLTVSRYATFEDLYTYCYRVASVVGLVCVEIFGYSDSQAKQSAIDLGIAMQLVNILRDIKEDSDRDRIYLPMEDLERFGYTESDLLQGVVNDQFVQMMAFQAERARHYFKEGSRMLPLVPFRSRSCPAILRGLYSELLKRIEANGYNVYHHRVRLSTPHKIWLAGKIWTTTTLKSLLPNAKSSS